jgi:hypothetical protein
MSVGSLWLWTEEGTTCLGFAWQEHDRIRQQSSSFLQAQRNTEEQFLFCISDPTCQKSANVGLADEEFYGG